MKNQNDNTIFLKKEEKTEKQVEEKPQVKKELSQEQKNLDRAKSLDK